MAGDGAYLSVKVEGIETLGTVDLVDVEDDDRLIDKTTVVFDDPNGVAAATMLEQRQVIVELGWSSEKARVFEGLVWRVKTESRMGAMGPHTRVTLVALDVSYKLHQGPSKPKVHPPGTLTDILAAIVAPSGIPIGQIKIDDEPQFTVDAPLVQGPKTDWAFIQELAVRYGARAFVEVNDDKAQFYFVSEKSLLEGDAIGEVRYVPGAGEIIEFAYQRLASAAAPVRSATVVDPLTGEVVLKKGTPPPAEAPLAVEPDEKSRLDRLGNGVGDVYAAAVDAVSAAAGQAAEARAVEDVAGAPSDPDRAAQTIKQDPTRALGLIGRGIAVGSVKLRAKCKLSIQGIAPWAAGDWYIRRVNHRVTRGSGLDEFRQPRGTFHTRFVVTR